MLCGGGGGDGGGDGDGDGGGGGGGGGEAPGPGPTGPGPGPGRRGRVGTARRDGRPAARPKGIPPKVRAEGRVDRMSEGGTGPLLTMSALSEVPSPTVHFRPVVVIYP